MDDSIYGTRDNRGNWAPNELIAYPPVFVWPPNLAGFLKWIPGYLFPWNALYAVIAILIWVYLTPLLQTMKSF